MRKELNIDGFDLIVSDDGRVWSPERYVVKSNGRLCHYKEKELTPHINNIGYMQITIRRYNNCKNFLVHRLMAIAFISNPDNLPMINHKDGNKQNNLVSNLEWCTQSYNVEHAHKTGLNKGCKKKIICVETGVIYKSLTEAAQSINTTKQSISNVCHGRWSHIHGYHYKLIN